VPIGSLATRSGRIPPSGLPPGTGRIACKTRGARPHAVIRFSAARRADRRTGETTILDRLKADLDRRFPIDGALGDEQVEAGLRVVLEDGLASQAMATLTTGPFLVGFALAVGSSNAIIGLLAAIPFLVQLLQLPAVFLVEALRRRRAICIIASAMSRLCLLVMAAAALAPKGEPALALLLIGLTGHAALGAVAGCSWNSWMRDFVPEHRLGTFFAKSLLLAAGLSAILSFLGGAFVDEMARLLPSHKAMPYAALILVGFGCGVLGLKLLAEIPEPAMAEPRRTGMLTLLGRPIADPNFRRLIAFLATWNLAVNLAAPFFAVFMLTTLKMDMVSVMTMTVVSLGPNVLFAGALGRAADRFGNKSILAVCGPLFILAIFAWTFVAFPDKHRYTMHMLVAIHLMMGFSAAGVTLASGNIGLKLAPKGEATAYLAVLSLVNALAAGIAPIVGGLFADFFADRELALVVQWFSPERSATVPLLILRHWGFFFAFASIAGLFSLNRLRLVREEGEVKERIVVKELMLEARRSIRNLSTVPGLRAMATPIALLRRRRGDLEDVARALLVPRVDRH
jgi:MFS family permease